MFWRASSLLLADPHGLLIIRFKELKVLIDLDGLPAVLAHVKHWLDLGDREVEKNINSFVGQVAFNV